MFLSNLFFDTTNVWFMHTANIIMRQTVTLSLQEYCYSLMYPDNSTHGMQAARLTVDVAKALYETASTPSDHSCDTGSKQPYNWPIVIAFGLITVICTLFSSIKPWNAVSMLHLCNYVQSYTCKVWTFPCWVHFQIYMYVLNRTLLKTT